jgi:hypothetical protein
MARAEAVSARATSVSRRLVQVFSTVGPKPTWLPSARGDGGAAGQRGAQALSNISLSGGCVRHDRRHAEKLVRHAVIVPQFDSAASRSDSVCPRSGAGLSQP